MDGDVHDYLFILYDYLFIYVHIVSFAVLLVL